MNVIVSSEGDDMSVHVVVDVNLHILKLLIYESHIMVQITIRISSQVSPLLGAVS